MKTMVEWILVMNATRARIIRGLPKPGEPAHSELVMRAESNKLRDIMSDKPGRSFSSGSGGRRSAMDYGTDPLLHDQLDFVREVFLLIEAHRLAGDFDRLAIFAAPHILGLLREKMPRTLRPVVSREVAKNLAGVAETALPDVLRHELGRDSGVVGRIGAGAHEKDRGADQ